MAANGQLVFTDVDKVTFKGVGNTSNAVIDTTTGKIGVGVDSPDANLHVLGNCFVSTNFELGGTMTMGTVTVRAQHELSAITATGNTTPHTVEFQNATTSFVTTANIEVGKDLTVSGNVAVDTDTLFVDSVNNRVGIGTTSPGSTLDVHGTGIHINGTVLRAMSAIGTVASGTYIKLCDFSALPATTSGVCAIRIRWGTGTGSGTYYYWQGHATGIVGYNTYGDGNGTFNGSGVEPLTLNHHYHYRTVGALSFRIDSDASGTSYGRHSIYMAPNASIDSMSFEVIAMPLRR